MDTRDTLWTRLRNLLLPREDDIHIATFNLFAVGGIFVSLFTAFYNLAVGFGVWNFLSILCVGIAFSASMVCYTRRTKRYQGAMILTVLVIFIGLFTFLFFTSGGYYGGMPCFFVLSVVFTAFLFDGIRMPVLVLAELAWYTLLCVYAYFHPVERGPVTDSRVFVTDVIVSMSVVSVVLAVTVFFHVRLHRRRQEDLERTKQEAEQANSAKTAFLARMSHDVRTPLNTIMAANELIGANTSSREIREWLSDSSNSAQILLSLVNDMLDISRIEAGKAELHLRPYNPADLILDAAAAWKQQVLRAGLHFAWEADPEIPSGLTGDQVAIRKIIDNLLSNAVKYTESGSVTLQVSFENEGTLVIRVADTGCGIGPEDTERIFRPFERGSAEGGPVKGSGLGLTIVRELTEYMNGSVTCRSRVGEGTVFTVRIPQEVSCAEPIGESEAWEKRKEGETGKDSFLVAPGTRILIVDDNLYNRKVIGQLLAPMLVQTDDVESGFEAIEMIDVKQYDLIFMDLRMPGMNGRETFDRIKAENPEFRTPVIALTAEIVGGVEESVRKQGFAGYLSKPVSSAQLAETIRRFVPEKTVTMPVNPEDEAAEENVILWEDRLNLYGIDTRLALERCAGSAGEFQMRAGLFEEYCEDTLRRLKESAGTEGYYLQIHSLKSAAKGIGARLLAEIAEAVEIRHDREFSEASHEILLREVERVRKGVRLFLRGGEP